MSKAKIDCRQTILIANYEPMIMVLALYTALALLLSPGKVHGFGGEDEIQVTIEPLASGENLYDLIIVHSKGTKLTHPTSTSADILSPLPTEDTTSRLREARKRQIKKLYAEGILSLVQRFIASNYSARGKSDEDGGLDPLILRAVLEYPSTDGLYDFMRDEGLVRSRMKQDELLESRSITLIITEKNNLGRILATLKIVEVTFTRLHKEIVDGVKTEVALFNNRWGDQTYYEVEGLSVSRDFKQNPLTFFLKLIRESGFFANSCEGHRVACRAFVPTFFLYAAMGFNLYSEHDNLYYLDLSVPDFLRSDELYTLDSERIRERLEGLGHNNPTLQDRIQHSAKGLAFVNRHLRMPQFDPSNVDPKGKREPDLRTMEALGYAIWARSNGRGGYRCEDIVGLQSDLPIPFYLEE